MNEATSSTPATAPAPPVGPEPQTPSPLPRHVQVHVEGSNLGQIAIGSDITQNQYILQVGSEHGGVAFPLHPGDLPEPSPRPTPVRLLPRPFPALLDRDAELSEAREALEQGRPVDLHGETGVGKTSLTRRLCHSVSDANHPDGALYESMPGRSPDEIGQWLFEAFYATGLPLKPTPQEIRRRLRDKRALLFLDDLDLTREQIESLLDLAPASAFHLVGRRRRIWGEGRAIHLEGLPREAGLRLLQSELGRDLDAAEREPASALVESLQGHPLRLLQAAAQIRAESLPASDWKARLGGESEIDEAAASDARSGSDSERRVLGTLLLFAGQTLAASHVAEAAGVETIDPALESLARRGLMETGEQGCRVADNLAKKLTPGWDLGPALDGALRHFSDWAERRRESPESIRPLAAALIVLLKKAAADGRWPAVLRLGRAVEGALCLGTRWDSWDEVLSLHLEAATAAEQPAERAWALHQMGTRSLCLSRFDPARRQLEEALRIRLRLGNEIGAALTRHNLELIPPVPAARSEAEEPSPQSGPGGGSATAPLLKVLTVLLPALLLVPLGLWLLGWLGGDAALPELTLAAATPTEISLAWSQGAPGDAVWSLERAPGVEGAQFEPIARIPPAGNGYRDQGLPPNAAFRYRLAAAGEDAPRHSETLAVWTLPATPEGLRARLSPTGGLKLTWIYPGPEVPEFEVERRRADGSFEPIARVGAGVTEHDDGQATDPNTRYGYRVRAVNAGGRSPYSDPAEATTAPDSPSGLQARALSAGEAEIIWRPDPSASGFLVERRVRGGFEAVATLGREFSFLDRGLSPDTAYVYRVGSRGVDGKVVYSDEATALTLPAAPPPPSAVAKGPNEIEVSWKASGKVVIERRGEDGFAEIAGPAPGVLAHRDSGLSPNAVYAYRLKAVNATGESPPSEATEATTLPSAPTGLVADTLAPDRVQLFWSDPNRPPAEIQIDRERGPGGPLTSQRVQAGRAGLQDLNLIPNTLYVYRVRAANSAGLSAPSNIAEALTLPAPPTDLSVRADSADALSLSWRTTGSNPAIIVVERADPNGTFTPVAEAPAGATRLIDKGLSPNTAYLYRVRASNRSGDSVFSNQAEGLTLPTPPEAVSAKLDSPEAIRLFWESSGGAESFRIQREDEDRRLLDLGQAALPELLDGRLRANTAYRYRVQAVNRSGASAFSDWVEALTPPAAPSRLRAVATAPDRVELEWRDNNPRPSAFKVERSDGRRGFQEVGWVDPGGARFSDPSVVPSSVYFYRVAAVNEAGFSDYCEPVEVVTPAWVIPAGIRLSAGTATGGQTVEAVLTLSAPAPASGLVARLGSSHPEIAEVPERIEFRPGEQQRAFAVVTSPRIRNPIRVRLAAETAAGVATADLTLHPPSPPDLAAVRIEFRLLGKKGADATLRITGVVRNLGAGEFASDPRLQRLLLYEVSGGQTRLVEQRRFDRLPSGGELTISAERPFRIDGGETDPGIVDGRGFSRRGRPVTAAPAGSRTTNKDLPAYRLVIEYSRQTVTDKDPANDDADPGNNQLERSSIDAFRKWRTAGENEPF